MSKEATSNYDELLKAIAEVGDESETMAKAFPDKGAKEGAAPDDKVIAAASEDSNDDADKVDEEQIFSKALSVVDAAGNPVDAIDATDLIKSLQDKVGEQDTVLAKALGGIGTILKTQNTLIKSLRDDMAKLAGQGAGRKAVFMAIDKPGVGDMAKSMGAADEGKLSVEDFFVKANTAFDGQKITGHELNTISVCIRQNVPIDPALIRKVALSS